ncbi:flagellin [Lachnospiraceae bacterium C1.1]|nr:flagellin [Lachnospiraceae bacterium C1.1]
MGIRVQHNITALNSQRNLSITTGDLSKSSEKLSSGYRINRAADDAAGLAVSEKMRRLIRGLTQASNNVNDGISFIQIADGALTEVDDMIHRITELSVKSANDTLTDDDRQMIQLEVNQLTDQIDNISTNTKFNEIPCFANDGYSPNVTTADILERHNTTVTYGFLDASGEIQTVTGHSNNSANSYTGDLATIADYVVNAAASAVAKMYSTYSSFFSSGASADIQVGLNIANIDGSGGTLASAVLGYSSTSYSDGTSTVRMTYKMNVDTSDFNISNYDNGELATTVAHEMTHLVMYDTLTTGMLSGTAVSFPSWFVEGMAQTSSGDNGWISGLGSSPSDSAVRSYMANSYYRDYGAGYLACMYLGYVINNVSNGGDGTVESSNITSSYISSGLDKLLTSLTTGIATRTTSLSDQIASLTGGKYSSASDFAAKVFTSTDDNAVDFIQGLITARGSSGAGSLLSELSTADVDVFTVDGSVTSNNYDILKAYNSVTNIFGDIDSELASISDYTASEISEDGFPTLLFVQAGSEKGQMIGIRRYDVSAKTLFGIGSASLGSGGTTLVNVSTSDSARSSLEDCKDAINRVANVRAYLGSTQNRLEHTKKNLDNTIENTTAAESVIRDTDMAAEMVSFSNNNILAQAGQSMLSQANSLNQGVLTLLQ